MLGVTVWVPSAVIGLVTAALTALGMQVGSRLGERFGPRVEILGGLVLIAIGLKILLQHIG
jgi:putative Mn2+ efflux pump MntP